jgi:hypothetical protein
LRVVFHRQSDNQHGSAVEEVAIGDCEQAKSGRNAWKNTGRLRPFLSLDLGYWAVITGLGGRWMKSINSSSWTGVFSAHHSNSRRERGPPEDFRAPVDRIRHQIKYCSLVLTNLFSLRMAGRLESANHRVSNGVGQCLLWMITLPWADRCRSGIRSEIFEEVRSHWWTFGKRSV